MFVAGLSLAPVFLLILLGWIAKRARRIDDGAWAAAEKATYYVFFPALLLESTATASLGGLRILPLAAALLGAVLAVAGLVALLKPRLRLTDAAFTSVFQGAIRPNTYVAIGIVLALYGQDGVAILSVALAVVVPVVNMLSVVALVKHGSADGDAGWGEALGQIARNPLILGILAGALLNVSGLGLPPVLGPLLHILGQAALPIGLLAVGAGLDLAAARAQAGAVWLTSAIKLGLLPVLTAGTCLLFGVDGLALAVSVVYGCAPCSATSYVMARQMGGDPRLMAGIITATTLGAAVAVPLALAALRAL